MAKVGNLHIYSRWGLKTNIFLSKVFIVWAMVMYLSDVSNILIDLSMWTQFITRFTNRKEYVGLFYNLFGENWKTEEEREERKKGRANVAIWSTYLGKDGDCKSNFGRNVKGTFRKLTAAKFCRMCSFAYNCVHYLMRTSYDITCNGHDVFLRDYVAWISYHSQHRSFFASNSAVLASLGAS